MAKSKSKNKPAMRSMAPTRSSRIAMMVAAGFNSESVWSALEKEYPSIIQDNAERKRVSGDSVLKFDEDLRGKVGRDINSTRRQTKVSDAEAMALVEATGGMESGAMRLDEIDMANRHRFSWNISHLDFIYGETRYIHLSDHTNSKYRLESKNIKKRDENGVTHLVEVVNKIWLSGSWRVGDPMIPDGEGSFRITRADDGSLLELDLREQKVEFGCPEAFMSIWGGSPGVGKTRLAIRAAKNVNRSTSEAILYVNGEANQEDFRSWVGQDFDPDLFHVVSATKIPVSRICEMVYQLRPRLVIIDSVQTLAEWDQGDRGQQTALTILRDLKGDIKAGKPHVLCISQLNKKGELKGSRMLEHLADLVAHVTKTEGRKGVFVLEVPNKNRGGETPRGALFRHANGTIECEGQSGDVKATPLYQLVQPSANPVIAEGVVEKSSGVGH